MSVVGSTPTVIDDLDGCPANWRTSTSRAPSYRPGGDPAGDVADSTRTARRPGGCQRVRRSRSFDPSRAIASNGPTIVSAVGFTRVAADPGTLPFTKC